METKTRIVLKLLVVMAVMAALVPSLALARPELDDFGGPWGYGGWGAASYGPAWCHSGNYGATALTDRATLNRIAGALGLTSAKLTVRLRDGDAVADIASEKGVKLQPVVDAALARHKDIVRWRVEDGYVTQTEADAALQLMEEQLRAAFEQGLDQGFGSGPGYNGYGGTAPFGGYGMGPGMMGGWGPMGGMMGGFWGRGGW